MLKPDRFSYSQKIWLKQDPPVMIKVEHEPIKEFQSFYSLDACQIFTTMNKDQYAKFGFLYLTEKYL